MIKEIEAELKGKKVIIKYNKIRMMFNSKKNIYNHKKRVYYSFSENIKNNYEVIFHEIKLNALNNIKNPKINYLITIDNIISNIEKFFKKLKNFLKSELKRPKDIVDLAKNVSSLKKEINISFLSEKENKMCYSCVLVNFIIEQLLNDVITKSPDYSNFVLSIDFDLEHLEKIRTDLNNSENKYMTTILNGVIKYASAIYNITYIPDINEMRCFKTLFEFDPGQFSFFKYENSLIYEKENEEVISSESGNLDLSNEDDLAIWEMFNNV